MISQNLGSHSRPFAKFALIGSLERARSPLFGQNRPATRDGPAGAGEPLLGRRGVALIEDIRIIVYKLLARFDVVERLDPDAAVVDDGIAVGGAGVIEEAGVVAVHGGVDDHLVIDGEEISVMTLGGSVGVTRVGFRGRDTLARVLNEADASRNVMRGKAAHPLNWRAANFKEWRVVEMGHPLIEHLE